MRNEKKKRSSYDFASEHSGGDTFDLEFLRVEMAVSCSCFCYPFCDVFDTNIQPRNFHEENRDNIRNL